MVNMLESRVQQFVHVIVLSADHDITVRLDIIAVDSI